MKIIKPVLKFLITVSTPFVFIMLAVQILLSPLFLQIEYHAPGFPADTYGFTTEDRLKWGELSIDYLKNKESIEFLAKETLADNTPLYNERELVHMEDVKSVVQTMTHAWLGVLAFWVVCLLVAMSGRWPREFFLSISTGGWLTAGLIGAFLLLIAIDFNRLFTVFHSLFFTGDTWIFEYSDHLIRLFPIRLWTDAFIGAGMICGVLSLLVILSRRWLKA